jgi:lipase
MTVTNDVTIRDVDVAGGTLRVRSYGTGDHHALAVHGITANATCWQAVARALPDDWTLHAIDVRGRGYSAGLPGPFGFDAHAADLREVSLALRLDRPVLAGHSLGAYIALLAADACPGAFSRLVLVDGGLPLPVPAGTDPDELMAATLGPALARLSQTYSTPEEYVAFWQAHPALTEWTSDLEEYVRYDLTGTPGALRSRVNADAVAADSRELLTAGVRIGTALRGLEQPTPLLRATAGMFGQPPGLIPEELAADWQASATALRVITIPDTNHYTILMAPDGAAAIAQHLTGAPSVA